MDLTMEPAYHAEQDGGSRHENDEIFLANRTTAVRKPVS